MFEHTLIGWTLIDLGDPNGFRPPARNPHDADFAESALRALTASLDDGIVVVMRDTMAAAPKLMSVEDYFATPETVLPAELAFGVLRVADAPAPQHQSVVGNIYWRLRGHLEKTGSGKVWVSAIDVILDRERALIVQPDVIAVMNDRLHIVTDRVWGAPDLVVEVLSPNPRIGKLDERVAWFAQYEVRECWLVHQFKREIEVIAFADGQISNRRTFGESETVDSGVLPALRITPAAVLSY